MRVDVSGKVAGKLFDELSTTKTPVGVRDNAIKAVVQCKRLFVEVVYVSGQPDTDSADPSPGERDVW